MIRRGSVTFGVNIQLFPLQETDFEMVLRSSDAQPASKFQEEKPKFGASSVWILIGGKCSPKASKSNFEDPKAALNRRGSSGRFFLQDLP